MLKNHCVSVFSLLCVCIVLSSQQTTLSCIYEDAPSVGLLLVYILQSLAIDFARSCSLPQLDLYDYFLPRKSSYLEYSVVAIVLAITHILIVDYVDK
jgi:hypothetical protein